MIITKVIYGWVNQQFDTETRRFVNQEFRGSDERHWEDEMGNELNMANESNREAVYGLGGVDEPYLNMEMVQPNYTVEQPPTAGLPRIDPLLAKATSFEVGERVIVIPSDEPYDLIRNEFMGTVVGIKDASLVQVKDADDEVFDCDPIQLHHVK